MRAPRPTRSQALVPRRPRFAAALVACLFAAAAAGRADEPAAAPDPEAVRNLEAAYPAAGPGRVRHVVLLPAVAEEAAEDLKVEVVAGKTIDTDGVNRFRFGGEFREKDIPGWGFSFLEVDALPGPLSTRIAPLEGAPAEKRFVAGPRMLMRYNSRLPIVVYAPAGVEIRTRVWRAEGEPTPAAVR